MPESPISALSQISATLLIPLYFRALESKEAVPIVFDPQASSIVQRLDFDFSKLKFDSKDRVFSMMRCRQFDRWAEEFLSVNQNCSVVEIGCGLSDRQSRLKASPATWYNLDLPEVMAIRRELIGDHDRSQFISGSAFDPASLDQIKLAPGEKCLFLAEGVLVYFPESEVKGLLLMLREHFPGCEIIFDALSPFMIALHKAGSRLKAAAAQLRWGLKDEADLERWGSGIQLLGSWRYFDQPEPRLGWTSLMRFIPPLAKGSLVLRYRLGIKGDDAVQRSPMDTIEAAPVQQSGMVP